MQPILHPQTHTKLQLYLKRPAHGLLLTGAEGSGKLYTAQWLAEELSLETVIITAPEGKEVITINQIRDLYSLTRTGAALAIILQDSHRLGLEAQNAFLKLLEEPPQNTHFILTSSDPTKLLETIRSRSQTVEIIGPPKARLLEFASPLLTSEQAAGLYHTASGLAGKFITLVDKELYQNHQSAVVGAKAFYTSSPYQRHQLCIEQGYEKEWSCELLGLLAIIVQSLLKQNSDRKSLKKLLRQSELIEVTAKNILELPGNPKIHLAKLCQQL